MDEKFTINECPTCGSEKIKKIRKNWSGEYIWRIWGIWGRSFFIAFRNDQKV